MAIVNNLVKAKRTTISAVITRADGTVEDLGVIAYRDANPLRNIWFKIRKRIFGKVK